jgi:hypothetical protein
LIVTVILFVVVFGLGTFFVFGGVIFTVSRQTPAFRPFTLLPGNTLQTVFVVVAVTTFDFATTAMPSVLRAEATVVVFFTPTVTTLGAAAFGVAVTGVPTVGCC